MKSKPLDNPRWERYVQERVKGLTQRQAMLVAYPHRSKWKPETVDNSAYKLESKDEVKARLTSLKQAAADKASWSLEKAIERTRMVNDKAVGEIETYGFVEKSPGPKAFFDSVDRLNRFTGVDRVIDNPVPEERDIGQTDFGLLLAPPFLAPHRAIAAGTGHDIWALGGRGSAKSSWASLEICDGLMHHNDRSAFVTMKNGVDMRGSVYEQYLWALDALGVVDEWSCTVSPMQVERKETGQVIRFRGMDKATKSKSIKAPAGTYFAYLHVEEADLFDGMEELRTVKQSLTRGADKDAEFFRIYTFNPPRSKDSWVNREIDRRDDEGKPVYRSSYLDVPPEWIPDQLRQDAEELKATDEVAYRHEYLGEPVGIGGEVFDRVEFREITDAEIAAFERPMAGQDFGWWPDPWAYTMSEWQAGQRQLLSWYEDGECKLHPPQMAKRIRKALTWPDTPNAAPSYHALRVQSDGAAPESISAQRDAGISAIAADKGNMRMPSYRWLASIKWVIDPVRCPKLAAEVRAKVHERAKDGEWLEAIEDGNDHYIDATRYAVMPIVAKWRSAYRGAE